MILRRLDIVHMFKNKKIFQQKLTLGLRMALNRCPINEIKNAAKMVRM